MKEALHQYARETSEGRAILHHGDCMGGDAWIALYAKSIGFLLASHPPKIDLFRAYIESDVEYPPDDYLPRDEAIVDRSKIVYGCPATVKPGFGGTWYTLRYTYRTAGDGFAFLPDGAKKSLKELFYR
jgi:hypothetical protein